MSMSLFSFSQNPISISGNVSIDSTCGGIDNVDILIIEGTHGFLRFTNTNANGDYIGDGLPPCDIYQIYASKEDFEPEYCGISKFDVGFLINQLSNSFVSGDYPDFTWDHYIAADVNKDRFTDYTDASIMYQAVLSYYCPNIAYPVEMKHWTFMGRKKHRDLENVGIWNIKFPQRRAWPPFLNEWIAITAHSDEVDVCENIDKIDFKAFILGDLVGRNISKPDCDCNYNAPVTPLSDGGVSSCYTEDHWDDSCSKPDWLGKCVLPFRTKNESSSRSNDFENSTIDTDIDYIISTDEEQVDIRFVSDHPSDINILTLTVGIPVGYSFVNLEFPNVEEDLNVKYYNPVTNQLNIVWVNMADKSLIKDKTIFTLQLEKNSIDATVGLLDIDEIFNQFIGSDHEKYSPKYNNQSLKETKLFVYPAIFDQSIVISSEKEMKNAKFVLYDTNGKNVFLTKLSNDYFENILINKELVSGAYYYKVIFVDRKEIVGKLIKI